MQVDIAQQTPTIKIGVLALQGDFRSHIKMLNSKPNIQGIEIRKPSELEAIHGLIIPGGESTTFGILAERFGLITAIRSFVDKKMPVWGTCAGLIFLSDKTTENVMRNQSFVGGLDVLTDRNYFGSQIESFTAELNIPEIGGEYTTVFIRAPAILEAGPDVQILSEIEAPNRDKEVKKVIVAVKQDNILATCFHPELTNDSRFHDYFLEMCKRRHPELKTNS